MNCKVCGRRSSLFGETTILRKHRVQYFRCDSCGFIQSEQPYWLEEAYSSAITRQDVGIMQRNLINRELTCAVLNLLYPKVTNVLDFGAGHGVLVRLMRDRGFNFFWWDKYASNDYARGFERDGQTRYDFVTAFEVLEHLVDPLADISAMMELSDNVFVSTELVPTPVPALQDWWYYSPSSGQHVAFYTRKSLEVIAARFGRHLLSSGSYHLFSKEPKSSLAYTLATKVKLAKAVNRMHTRPSLIQQDHRDMSV